MSTTPHLALPLIAAAQAQKHVTHNEALHALDALVQCAVLDRDLSSPPDAPAEGAAYIVGPEPDGAWTARAGQIVLWRDGYWLNIAPKAGFLVYVLDEALLCVFTGGGWSPLAGASAVLQNLERLGIGTHADAETPFAAKLGTALWTARALAEGGTGDLRYVLNKEGAANVLSLLFQSGYSGRCEIGLVGSDDLVAKVSTDGAVWREAARIDAASGSLDFLSAETSLASAPTLDLGAARSRRVLVTGTTTITSFGLSANRERLLRFAGSLTLVHNAIGLAIEGGANIVTAAGDTALALSDGSGNWRVIDYRRASGRPLGLGTTDSPSFAGVTVSAAASAERGFSLRTAGIARWSFYAYGGVESGGNNQGSDFGIRRHADGGGGIDNPLSISRASGEVTIGSLRVNAGLRLPSYTVATLPAAGIAGRIAHCSNARVFSGAGVQEPPGAGTGGLVHDNGSAWKIAGTNVTASA